MLRSIARGVAVIGLVVGMGGFVAGCIDRPVTAQAPTITTHFTVAVSQSGIDKVDILFDIDNSASMGDKQAYLVEAIPQMVARLVTPRCLDNSGVAITGENSDPSTGQCATGTPEFSAVHDMHIGVVTSSLGSRLGDACTYTTVKSGAGYSVSAYNDDHGHLINRGAPNGSGAPLSEANLPDAGAAEANLFLDAGGAGGNGGFLNWFPALGNTGKTAVTPPSGLTSIGDANTPDSLVGDFAELVGGAGESGCGIESQLESWYRFLIQPDPYLALNTVPGTPSPTAVWSGVDATILQQRHDFLRPDSLVVVIVLTDENDSEIDVRSYPGLGYKFMSQGWAPSHGTAICATSPNDPGCTSCAYEGHETDPACVANGGVYTDGFDWGYNLNLRHVHMQERYGVNPQFPLTRYYNGLTSTMVPNRNGEYPPSASSYVGANNCVNPLFASSLPTAADVPDFETASPSEIDTTLCKLTPGATRTAADVFYAHIGGVPHQLLQSVPGDGTCPATTAPADCPQKDQLAATDWTKILGKSAAAYSGDGGTLQYDYTGIDPHMVESETPRNMLPSPPASAPAVTTLSGPSFGSGVDPVRPDPINGREWTTNGTTAVHSLQVDREYACIFQLPLKSQRDCASLAGDTIEGNSCDCVPGPSGATGWSSGEAAVAPGNSPEAVPPLCSKTSTDTTADGGPSVTSKVSDYTVQTYAKAYPTIRELTLANMMGKQGIVSSLCPIHTVDNTPDQSDPLYGYRPAVNAIVNRLKDALGAPCVPKLTPDKTGAVECLVLVSFKPDAGGPGSSNDCASLPGYANVDPGVLKEFNTEQQVAAGDGGSSASLANDVTCELKQIPVPEGSPSCVGGANPGWCYLSGASIGPGSACSQEIAYSGSNAVPEGATISLQCVQAMGGGS